MNLTKQLSLFTLAINILISLSTFGMERKLAAVMIYRYAYLREISLLLDRLVYTPQHSKDKKEFLIRELERGLEPEEIDLIELAFALTRDSSRPVGRLLKFWDAEELLKEKLKIHLKNGQRIFKDAEQQEYYMRQPVGIERTVMPWEMIAPQVTSK